MKTRFVIVIAGPTGVGKTTLSKMISNYYHCAYLSEDEIAKEIYPDLYEHLEDYPDKQKIAESEMFERTKEIFDRGECVVIDLINFGKEFQEEIQNASPKELIIKVLWPPIFIAIERDKRREGWTSGELAVKHFYKKYEELKPIIGESNYIDNSHQTPQETLQRFIEPLLGKPPGTDRR
jgi:cytidylate kinase